MKNFHEKNETENKFEKKRVKMKTSSNHEKDQEKKTLENLGKKWKIRKWRIKSKTVDKVENGGITCEGRTCYYFFPDGNQFN